MDISICVGSSCHLRGAASIIELMKNRIEKENLSSKVDLKASFCLGHCTDGVSVKIGNEIVGFSPENFDVLFDKYIASKF